MSTNVLGFAGKQNQSQPVSGVRDAGRSLSSGRLLKRLAIAGAVIAAEVCLIAALGHPWMDTHQIGTAPIAFLFALAFFGRKRFREAVVTLDAPATSAARYVLLHGVALVLMVGLDVLLYGAVLHHRVANPALVALWCVSLILLVGSATVAAIDPQRIRSIARQMGAVWIYASVCALAAVFFREVEYVAWDAPSSWLGNHLAGHAFRGVKFLLELFYSHIEADPATRILGTAAFRIHVAGTCSGVEGLGLTTALTLGWIMYERRRLHVGRALLLVPMALCVMWVLNLLRMTALVAIGLAGYRQLALTGFHTEAGWIAFALVSIGFLLIADRVEWFHRDWQQTVFPLDEVREDSAVVAYVLPFVAILATSLLTRAFSTIGFEVLYPVRLVMVGLVLLAFRKRYAQMQWKASWVDLVAGVTVGAVWAYVDRHADGSVISAGLSVLTPSLRAAWIMCRVIAAVVTVPLAEELAFRGFLARWLVAERFENVPYAAYGVWSVAVSSLAFGGMHGGMWIAGAISGVVFAMLAKRRNSLGGAVVAHAAANAVLAVIAVTQGAYGLW